MSVKGVIGNRQRGQQIIDMSGLLIGNITPTDVDGLIEYKGRLYIFFELKYGNKDLPYGQKLALCRVIDSLDKPAVLFVAEHEAGIDCDIDAATAVIREYYYRSDWRIPKKETTLKDGVLQFIAYTENKTRKTKHE